MAEATELVARFCSRRPSAAPVQAALAEVLPALLAEATAAWPDLKLPAEDFVMHLAAQLAPEAEMPAALLALRGGDLYLALGCAQGMPAALVAYEREYVARAAADVRRVHGDAAFVDDVLQQLRERLLVAQGDTAPRIAEYGGRGDLLGWTRTVALRIAIGLRRRARPEEADPDQALEVRAPEHDPELGYMKAHSQAEFLAALREALGQLGSEQRNLLHLHLVEGLRMDQLGRIFQVSEATISRRLGACREALAGATRRGLQERLGIGGEELDALGDLLRSRLDLSLRGLLREVPP